MDSPRPNSFDASLTQLKIETEGRLLSTLSGEARRLGKSGSFEGVHGAGLALLFSGLYRASPGTYLWICSNNREAETTAEYLRFFLPPDAADRALVMPGCEASPYTGLSPHPEISQKRATALWRLLRGFQGFIVTTLASLATRIPSTSSFTSHCQTVSVGDFLPLSHLLEKLHDTGYVREDPVVTVGDYSVRGGIVDLYSPLSTHPVRIEFFGDQVETIRKFDPVSQRSVGLVPEIEIIPMREMVVTDHEISMWHEQAPLYWSHVRYAEALSEKLQFTGNLELFNGFEYLFPVILECRQTLLGLLADQVRVPPPSVILPHGFEVFGGLQEQQERLKADFHGTDAEGGLSLPLDRLFVDSEQIREKLNRLAVYEAQEVVLDGSPVARFDFRPERVYQGRIPELLADLREWSAAGHQTVLVMSSKGLAERVRDIFREYDVSVTLADSGFEEAIRHPLSVTVGKIDKGFQSSRLGLHLLTEADVFPGSTPTATMAPPRREGIGPFVSDFRDLKLNDLVVHVEHGIGIFKGLKRIGVGQETKEFVELRYRNDAKLYVPVDKVGLLQKYSGGGEATPPLDRLGSGSWERTKQRIKRSMRDMAEDLLKLYAQREVAQGFACAPDDALMREFEEAFAYTETPDQISAIRDVKGDLESPRPADRLICGDVGYGKTEVAMRAAFKMVKESKQVAVLAPTTVLAVQHLNTFRERFKGFPVNIEMVSRFRSHKEQRDTLEQVSLGLVDILIGTHRLLSKDVKFHDLGLVVVDEEQRFGVAQKEKLKRLKTRVDVLTLSATPIPRTLNLSLVGLRDLSIIETPPKDRLAIQTVVVRFNRQIIRNAIDLELKRQGQVFFLHNSVETIYSIAQMVQDIVPEARVAVAHGQMPERSLEKVMLGFLNYQFDVLVSTTIIENGLDIPRANTLIVNQSHCFGLSQLYQLRGRVGRSSRRAYAYLLVPSEEILTTDARKRLAAIREFSELGAGFRIAALDLEIRGAGNFLGGEQHGHIRAVGFELYMKMLQESLQELKGEKVEPEVETTVDLGFDIQIPEHYLPDSNQRLWLYRRISSAQHLQALEQLKEELVDRFGAFPKSVNHLFEYAQLRQRGRRLKLLGLERKGDKVNLRFREDTPVSVEKIAQWISRDNRLRLQPGGMLQIRLKKTDSSFMFAALTELLDEIPVVD